MAASDAAAAAAPTPEQIAADADLDRRVGLVTRNLQEVLGADKAVAMIRKIMLKRPLRIYWGTAPTGAPHIGYFVPMLKIADFLHAGCEVTILLADLHASLDALKSTFDLVEARSQYYQACLTQMLLAIGVNIEKLRFVRGSSFQLRGDYTLDAYKLMAVSTLRNASRAGAEVVKQATTDGEAPLSGLCYPLLQALDEEYLNVDLQFGGIDQRKIFTYAQDYLPKLKKNKKDPKYNARIHICNPMVPSLTGNKMSASETDSKIDILEAAGSVRKKIRKAFCADGNIEQNGVLSFCKFVLCPWRELTGRTAMEIQPPKDKEAPADAPAPEPIVFATYAELEEAFAQEKVTPQLLKKGATDALNALLSGVTDRTALAKLQKAAYPTSTKKTKAAAESGLERAARREADLDAENEKLKAEVEALKSKLAALEGGAAAAAADTVA